MVQRQHHAAGADLHPLGDRRDGRAGDRGVGVQAAERMEVALGRPHRGKAVLVAVLRAFEQQPVLVGDALGLVAGEVEQAEVQRAMRMRAARRRGGRAVLVGRDDDVVAARQRPAQLEHRDVERQAGDGEPGARRVVAEMAVHAGEEVHHVAVLDHHALGLAGRARGVDHVGQVARLGAAVEGVGRFGADRGPVAVQAHHLAAVLRQVAAQALLRQQHGHLGVFHHVGDAVARVGRVQRHVGAAGLVDADQADDQLHRALGHQAHQRVGAHAQRRQAARELAGTAVEFGVGQRDAVAGDGRAVGRARGLLGEQAVHAGVGAHRRGGRVPVVQHAMAQRRVEQRQLGQRPLRVGVGAGQQLGELRLQRLHLAARQLGAVEQPAAGAAVLGERHGEFIARARGGRVERAHDQHRHRQHTRVARHGHRAQLGGAGHRVGGVGAAPAQLRALGGHRVAQVRKRQREVDLGAQRHLGREPCAVRADLVGQRRVGEADVERVLVGQAGQQAHGGRQERVAAIACRRRMLGVEMRPLRRLGRRAAIDGRQFDRLLGFQATQPEGFVRAHRGVERRQARDRVGSRHVEPGTGAQAELGLGFAGAHGTAAGGFEAGQAQVAVGGGHRDARQVGCHHGAGFSAGRRGGVLGGSHQQHAAGDAQLGRADRVGVGAEVERTHQRGDALGALVPADRAGGFGPVLAAVVALQGAGLGLADEGAVLEAGHQFLEAFDGGFVVARVQRQRGLGVAQREALLDQDVALVHLRRHRVPGDAVGLLAVEQRPHRRVQAGVLGQRAVVEVDRATHGQGQHVGRQHREVGDAEQVVDAAQVARGAQRCGVGQHANAACRGPFADGRTARHDGGDGVPPLLQDLGTLDQQRLAADQHATP